MTHNNAFFSESVPMEAFGPRVPRAALRRSAAYGYIRSDT